MSKTKKQTAVEWLQEELDNINKTQIEWHEAFNQAKAMEKEQIEKAVIYGNRQDAYDGTETIGSQYYNETYNND